MTVPKKLKIFYIITKSNFGGAQRYLFDLTTSLSKNDFDISVITGGNGLLIKKLIESKIEVITLEQLGRDINLKNDFLVFIRLLKLFWQEKPDIVHLNSSKIGGLGSLAARLTGIKKIIFTAHGFAFNEEGGLAYKITTKLLSWITILLCHQVIAVSVKDTLDGKSLPFCKNKVVTIHNGIAAIDFLDKKAAQNKLSSYLNISPDTKTIWLGTIAELHPNKGVEYAIQALLNLKEKFIYIIIGGGQDHAKLQNMISRLGLSNKVFLVGFIENAPIYLKAFDTFVLSSTKEGLPYVLLESGQAKLATVASDVGGIKEIIDNNKSGLLIKSKDIGALKTAIENLINDPNLRERLSDNMKIKVEREFALKKMLEETIKIYNS